MIGIVLELFRDIEFEVLLMEKFVLLLLFNYVLIKRKIIFVKDLIYEMLIIVG